jgi:hypothetical protein
MRLYCGSGLRQLLEVPIEARPQRATVCPIGADARENDEIPGRQSALLTEGLTRETFDFVAVHGASRSSA